MEAILLNVLFLLVVLFVTQTVLEKRVKQMTIKFKKRLYIFLSSSISIIFCMSFSIRLAEEYLYDIRAVPFIFGSLFGGPLVTIGLFAVLVLYRLFIGVDIGFLSTTINFTLLAMAIYFVSKIVPFRTLHQRLYWSISLVILHQLIRGVLFYFMMGTMVPALLFFQVAALELAAIVIVIFAADSMERNQQLRRNMGEVEKMELISHLSASISHEVRNGLTGVSGFIQLLREKETDDTKKEYIRIALEELERTESIIRDFLTFAKPAPESVKCLQVDELMSKTIEIIKPYATMNSIEVQAYLSPFTVVGEEKLLQQALLNFLKNAIEAMPNGGRLDIQMISNPNWNMIMIKDTGVGMSEEQMERLGKPYFTTKGQKGTGLGMMVSYRVIQELNGTINTYSQLGKGTTFTIQFPR